MEDTTQNIPVKKRRGRPAKKKTTPTVSEVVENLEETIVQETEELEEETATSENESTEIQALDDTVVSGLLEGIHRAMNRFKDRPCSVKRFSNITTDVINFQSPTVSYLLGAAEQQSNVIVDITGQEGVGKTSLVMFLLGRAAMQGCPTLFINTETKTMTEKQMLRCISPVKSVAKRLFNSMLYAESSIPQQVHDEIISFVSAVRDPASSQYVPRDKPIIIAVDTLSKLLSNEEAGSITTYGKIGSKKKELLEGSNFTFSKSIHEWMRVMHLVCREHNVMLILVNHQMEKMDFTPSFIPAAATAATNKNKRGGKAIDQSACYQLVLTKGATLKDTAKNVIGFTVKAVCTKNSRGRDGGARIEYELINSYEDENEEYFLDEAIRLDEALVDLLLENDDLKTTVTAKRYTCEELGIEGKRKEAFWQEVASDKAKLRKVMRALKVDGF